MTGDAQVQPIVDMCGGDGLVVCADDGESMTVCPGNSATGEVVYGMTLVLPRDQVLDSGLPLYQDPQGEPHDTEGTA